MSEPGRDEAPPTEVGDARVAGGSEVGRMALDDPSMMGGVTGERLGYRPELDGLRGVAVAGVVAVHTGAGWAAGGDVGVYVFFVLSGFLITRLLLEEQSRRRVDLVAFWRRRAARLLPGLVAMLAVAGLWAVLNDDGATLAMIPSVLFYGANWYRQGTEAAGVLGHTWSLAVEEQFYVLWPLVFLALPVRRRTGWWLIIGGLGGSLIWRGLTFDPAHPGMLWRTDYNLDLLLVGAGAAFLWKTWRPQAWMVVVSALALLFVPRLTPIELAWLTPTWVSVASAVLICWALTARPAALSVTPLVWLGKISYSLYLWHVPVFGALLWSGVVPAWVAVVVAVLVADASYRWVEQPLRQRFIRPKDAQPALSVGGPRFPA